MKTKDTPKQYVIYSRKSKFTGKGESIDWAMYEGIMYMSQYYLVDFLNDGIKWPRAGARNQNLCGIGVYKCKDGSSL